MDSLQDTSPTRCRRCNDHHFLHICTLSSLSRSVQLSTKLRRQNFVMGLSMIFQVSYGLGQHVETIDPQDLRKMMMWFWLSIWTYYSAQGFAKLAILFQYLRIFGNIKKFRIACWCVILACGFYTLWGTVTAILICIPVAGFWELEWQSNGRARCMPIWRVKIPIW